VNVLDPRVAGLLRLSSVTDEEQLENLSLAELEAMEIIELQQLELIRKLATGSGVAGSFAARKFLLPRLGRPRL